METKEKLAQLRQQIDQIDQNLVQLFHDRLLLADTIADVKADGNLAVNDQSREKQVLETAQALTPPATQAEAVSFMRGLMAISKLRQNKRLLPERDLYFPLGAEKINQGVRVVYQGLPGAWGEEGSLRLFPQAVARPVDYFEDVFLAVKDGKADYGVLPIENSQTGAIGEVFDLLRGYGCYIVGETWTPVAHCLLAGPQAELNQIREVFSHPEGFRQCRRFLKNKPWTLTPCSNTAAAAQKAAGKNDRHSAAIGSRRAAEIYGLAVLAPDIIDDPSNKTRFIAIGAQPVYDQNSDAISITFSTAHQSGALCAVLQSFMLAGINLSRIESRPAAGGKYRFFADLQGSMLDKTVTEALKQASVDCEYFEILGCYPATNPNHN